MRSEKEVEETSIGSGSKKKKVAVLLPRCTRFILFILIVSVELAINISSGLLSSASKNIKFKLHMNDQQFGMFGTSNGFGRVLGSLFFTITVNCLSRKCIFVSFLIMKSILLISFKFIHSGWALIVIRGFIGFVHMPPSIYVPVWIDQYGISKYKQLFMTILLVVIPVGKVAGYLVHILVGEDNWQLGFALEGLYLLFVAFCMLITSEKYFSSKLFSTRTVEDLDKHRTSQTSSFQDKVDGASNEENKKKGNFFTDFKELITNPVYLSAMFVRSLIMGVLTVLHYWIGDYMRTTLEIDDSKKIFFSYSIMATLGPIIAAFFSPVITYFVPSYEHRNAGYAMMVVHFISSCFGLWIPFCKNLFTFSIAVTLYLAVVSCTTPFAQGFIGAVVPPKLKGTAFAFANTFTMLFTSGPSPMIYGMINDRYKSTFKPFAMLVFMIIYASSALAIVLYVILRLKSLKNKDKKEKLVENEEGVELKNKEENTP